MSDISNPNPTPPQPAGRPTADESPATLDELASIYIDGQATPQQRAQIESDPALLARVEQFRQVGQLVSAPVSPPDRDEITAGALAVYDQLHPLAGTQPPVGTNPTPTAQPAARPAAAQRIFGDDDDDFTAAHTKSKTSRRQARFGRAVPAFVGVSVLAVLAMVSVVVLLINEDQDSTETAEQVIEVADGETAESETANDADFSAATDAAPGTMPDDEANLPVPEMASAPAPQNTLPQGAIVEEPDSANPRARATDDTGTDGTAASDAAASDAATDDAATDDRSAAVTESASTAAPATPQAEALDLDTNTAPILPVSPETNPACPDDDLLDDGLANEDLLEENATQTSIEAEVENTNVEDMDAGDANAAASGGEAADSTSDSTPDGEATDPAPTSETEPAAAPNQECP